MHFIRPSWASNSGKRKYPEITGTWRDCGKTSPPISIHDSAKPRSPKLPDTIPIPVDDERRWPKSSTSNSCLHSPPASTPSRHVLTLYLNLHHINSNPNLTLHHITPSNSLHIPSKTRNPYTMTSNSHHTLPKKRKQKYCTPSLYNTHFTHLKNVKANIFYSPPYTSYFAIQS